MKTVTWMEDKAQGSLSDYDDFSIWEKQLRTQKRSQSGVRLGLICNENEWPFANMGWRVSHHLHSSASMEITANLAGKFKIRT